MVPLLRNCQRKYRISFPNLKIQTSTRVFENSSSDNKDKPIDQKQEERKTAESESELWKKTESKKSHKESTPSKTDAKKLTKAAKSLINKGPKKFPEEPTSCCMSGCANCVWLNYAEELSEYFKDGGERAIKEINEKITDPNLKAFLLQELRMRQKKK